ncbi:MAG: hypothetical protein OQL27_08045 [Sedimenticola sp.]|nr:hypothetical protein [Sedimenticola sp.]
MVSPISNDKILPPSNDRNSTSSGSRSGSAQDKTAGTHPAPPLDDSVELSSAGRLVSQDTNRSSGSIQTAEQAKILATEIREQIESAGKNALQAHGQLESGQLTRLLESSAA